MSNRTSIILNQPKDRVEAEGVVDEIARLITQQRKLTVARDAASQAVLDKYNPQIKEIEAQIDELTRGVAPFVAAHRQEFLGKNCSASSSLAMYGFRKGSPALTNISGKPDAAIAFDFYEADRHDCAEAKYSLKKSGIKSALKKGDDFIAKFFVIEAVERFYVDPKTDKEVGE